VTFNGNGNGHNHHAQPVENGGDGGSIVEIFTQQLQIIEQQIALLDESERVSVERNGRT
jgi:hypothetical protein